MKPSKLGFGLPCPCGSGKEFNHCCLNGNLPPELQKLLATLQNDLVHNPRLSMDDVEGLVNARMQSFNQQGLPHLCGLSPEQMHNWEGAAWGQWQNVSFNTPADLSSSPVMRFLEVLLQEMLENNGSIKLTSKGNLPMRVVQQCVQIASSMPVLEGSVHISISEFKGRNEDDYNALHYTRVLAEIAGILYKRSGRLHFKKDALKAYQKQGLAAFYGQLLDAATSRYNWGYLDGYTTELQLQRIWLFMLWRLQGHCSIQQLADEVEVLFEPMLQRMPVPEYNSWNKELRSMIFTRFVVRFLGYFGLVRAREKDYMWDGSADAVEFTPLMTQSFRFEL